MGEVGCFSLSLCSSSLSLSLYFLRVTQTVDSLPAPFGYPASPKKYPLSNQKSQEYVLLNIKIPLLCFQFYLSCFCVSFPSASLPSSPSFNTTLENNRVEEAERSQGENER